MGYMRSCEIPVPLASAMDVPWFHGRRMGYNLRLQGTQRSLSRAEAQLGEMQAPGTSDGRILKG